jgi:cytochrome P450
MVTTPVRRSPPGPFGHPVLGNLRDLQSRVLDFFCSLQPSHGDISTIRFSVRKVSYVQHPDLIQYILQENNRNYTKSLRYEQLKYLLGNGLLTSEGDFWLRQRRLMQPAFHRQKLEKLCADMVSCTRETLEAWGNLPKNKSFNIATEMMALTLQIVGKTMLSADVRSDAKEVGDALSFLLRAVNVRTRTPVLLPLWVPTPHHQKIKRSIRIINSVLDKIFEERRASSVDREDLLSMLMEVKYEDTGQGMDNKQLRDEVMTVFVAGHETTANALSWTLYLLARHNDVLKNCIREIDNVLKGKIPDAGNLQELHYLTRVIDESMRLYPPAWVIGRKTIKPDVIGGHRIPAGHNILISPFALHRDSRFFPDPMRFDPDRFTPEEIKKRPKFSYIPFGGGPRICIGNNFAMMEMQVVLSMILQKFIPENNSTSKVIPEPLITLRPSGGINMRMKEREN